MDFEKYNVIITQDVKDTLDSCLKYLMYIKRSVQAASNLLQDYNETLDKLEIVAGSLSLEPDKKLAGLGYRRIHFIRHKYFLMYRIDNNTVIVDKLFHELQDYTNSI